MAFLLYSHPQRLIRSIIQMFRMKHQQPMNSNHFEKKRFIHYLTTTNGAMNCNACLLCVSVCPAQCMYIKPIQKENHCVPEEFSIDVFRCIFCGYCRDICPSHAIDFRETIGHSSDERSMMNIVDLVEKMP